jgi:hypothetical protein
LRGREAGLHGGLVGLSAEVGEEVADLLLALGDDVPGGGLVDGVSDLLTELVELGTQLFAESVGGELGLGVHESLQRR